MTTILRASTILLLLLASAWGSPFHVSAKEREKWPDWLRAGIMRAEEDFKAVVEGRKPIHAKPIQGSFPTDGGSGVYQGEGYKITVIKRLTSDLGGGIFYGPSLRFDSDILSEPVADIRYYSVSEFGKLTESEIIDSGNK